MPSIAVEDYLKTIHALSAGEAAASTSAIAERLNIAAGSVTGMLKRLAERGLVEHVPYYGARLTAEGEREAVRLIRRHRVLELFLVQVLGYTWDRVHEEAERLEHAATDELINRMASVLGEPQADPHGAPIPRNQGRFVELHFPTLGQLAVGARGVLRRVQDEDPEALRYLAELQLMPGAELRLLERAPFNGPLKVEVAGRERFVGVELANSLEVEALDESRSRNRKPRAKLGAGGLKDV
ncbi:MAG: metal-dependent transcriptional regulator [Longimicrobiales bacterium]